MSLRLNVYWIRTTTLHRLNHPFIVSVQYAFHNDRKVYLVCDRDLCENCQDLYTKLPLVAGFTEKQTRYYSAEIFLALKYLHSKHIIFVNFCPQNILLDNDGHIKIIDLTQSTMRLSANDQDSTFEDDQYFMLIIGFFQINYSHNHSNPFPDLIHIIANI